MRDILNRLNACALDLAKATADVERLIDEVTQLEAEFNDHYRHLVGWKAIEALAHENPAIDSNAALGIMNRAIKPHSPSSAPA